MQNDSNRHTVLNFASRVPTSIIIMHQFKRGIKLSIANLPLLPIIRKNVERFNYTLIKIAVNSLIGLLMLGATFEACSKELMQ